MEPSGVLFLDYFNVTHVSSGDAKNRSGSLVVPSPRLT